MEDKRKTFSKWINNSRYYRYYFLLANDNCCCLKNASFEMNSALFPLAICCLNFSDSNMCFVIFKLQTGQLKQIILWFELLHEIFILLFLIEFCMMKKVDRCDGMYLLISARVKVLGGWLPGCRATWIRICCCCCWGSGARTCGRCYKKDILLWTLYLFILVSSLRRLLLADFYFWGFVV